MQSSWGARRLLPGPPVQEHARPRPQGRPASLPRERGRDLLEDTAMLLRGPPASFTVTHRCVSDLELEHPLRGRLQGFHCEVTRRPRGHHTPGHRRYYRGQQPLPRDLARHASGCTGIGTTVRLRSYSTWKAGPLNQMTVPGSTAPGIRTKGRGARPFSRDQACEDPRIRCQNCSPHRLPA